MNPSLEGKAYPAVPLEVEEVAVRRFAAAVGDDRPGVPLTFLTTAEIVAAWAPLVADADLALDFSRVVHAEQEYRFERPLEVGDRLEARATIESIRSKGGHGFLTIRTEFTDVGTGESVATARSVLLERGDA
ncbi:MAG: MaoC family dehydratase N-terminal domain-containing protein [Actinomycetota bacterium]